MIHGNSMGNTITVKDSNISLVATNIGNVNNVGNNINAVNNVNTYISQVTNVHNNMSDINDLNVIELYKTLEHLLLALLQEMQT